MTLIFGGYPVDNGGGGTSIDFSYPKGFYASFWVLDKLKYEAFKDSWDYTDIDTINDMIICNCAEANLMTDIDSGLVTGVYNGKTLTLQYETNPESEEGEVYIVGYYDSESVNAIVIDNMIEGSLTNDYYFESIMELQSQQQLNEEGED